MAVVYRIQNLKGRGPWIPGFSAVWVEDRADLENLKPFSVDIGRVDRNRWPGYSVGCGCESIEQLRRWFTEGEYHELLANGFAAVRLNDVRILGRSETQCVFERRRPLYHAVSFFELYDGAFEKDRRERIALKEALKNINALPL